MLVLKILYRFFISASLLQMSCVAKLLNLCVVQSLSSRDKNLNYKLKTILSFFWGAIRG